MMFSITTGKLIHDEVVLFNAVEDGVSLLETPDGGAFLKVVGKAQTSSLGMPRPKQFTLAHRYEPFWMRPAVAETAADIPAETQLLLGDLDGRVMLVVPLAEPGGRCSLEGSKDGRLWVVVEGDADLPPDFAAVYLAVQDAGEHLHTFLARAAAEVARHLKIKLRHEKPLPAFAEELGWCTWDAFYQEVCPEKIREGLRAFCTAGVPVGFIIVDDGWQSERNLGEERGRRLTSFSPNEKFGGDFSALVREAKEEFGLHHVLAWHSMTGYWAGVETEAFPGYGAREVRRNFSQGILRHWPEANTKWWGAEAGVVSAGQVGRFFNEYHTLLKSQGIDGVKVDNQAALEGLLHPGETRGELYAAYRAALEQSVDKHFAGNVLHCMSCANDLLYARGETALTRTSTDFWPGKPETHGLHLWTNALVSLWFGQFVHPDWDMFQTHLEGGWSAFHAAARAISGGPVYVSDVPRKTEAGLLNRLVCEDGTVPRCDGPAMMARESLFADMTRAEALLKLVNTNRGGRAGVVGLFHCGYDLQGAGEITGAISPEDVEAIAGHERYLVCVERNGIADEPRVMRRDERVSVVLRQAGYAIATIVPIVEGIAVAGLMDKMNPGATVGEVVRDGGVVRISMRGSGRLGLWSENGVAAISQNGRRVAPVTSAGAWVEVEVEAGEVVVNGA